MYPNTKIAIIKSAVMGDYILSKKSMALKQRANRRTPEAVKIIVSSILLILDAGGIYLFNIFSAQGIRKKFGNATMV